MLKVFNFCLTFLLTILVFNESLYAQDRGDNLRPSWVEDPYTKCEQLTQFCVVGEGPGQNTAKINARREISLIFEAKISGEKTFSKSSHSKEGEDGGEGHIIESSYSEVREVTESVLNGIEITGIYSDDESVYALATLNKRKSASLFLEEMNKIDQQMDLLIKEKNRVNTKKLKRLYQTRREINKRYQITKGQFYPEKYTLKKINKIGESRKKIEVFINIDQKNNLFELKGFLSTLLGENDYLVLPKKREGTLFTLEGKLKSEEVFLKVKGFKRYRFNLDLYFVNQKGKKVKSLNHSFLQDGRTFKDIRFKALKEIRNYLLDTWGEITIE